MTTALHSAIVGSFAQILPAMLGQIDKAEAFCREKTLPDTALTNARLIDDMWPYAKQLALCAVHSAGAIAAVRAGVARPDASAAPTDFASLRNLIANAIGFIESLDPGELDAIAGQDLRFEARRPMDFTVGDYLLTFALPNFHFHAAMAYAILRKEGVAVGKMDYLGQIKLKAI